MSRRYTDTERAEALDLSAQVGFAEASRRLGIPSPTLRSWAHRAELVLVGADSTALATTDDGKPLPWAERRQELIPRFGGIAGKALDACMAAIEKGNGRQAQAFATTAAIAVDKAQLLAGGATSRSESASIRLDARSQADVTEQVRALRAELGYPAAIEAGTVGDG